MERWIFLPLPLISQTGCVAKCTMRDVVTDNHGSASLSDSLAISNGKFVRHVAGHQSQKHVRAAVRRALEGWR